MIITACMYVYVIFPYMTKHFLLKGWKLSLIEWLNNPLLIFMDSDISPAVVKSELTTCLLEVETSVCGLFNVQQRHGDS